MRRCVASRGLFSLSIARLQGWGGASRGGGWGDDAESTGSWGTPQAGGNSDWESQAKAGGGNWGAVTPDPPASGDAGGAGGGDTWGSGGRGAGGGDTWGSGGRGAGGGDTWGAVGGGGDTWGSGGRGAGGGGGGDSWGGGGRGGGAPRWGGTDSGWGGAPTGGGGGPRGRGLRGGIGMRGRGRGAAEGTWGTPVSAGDDQWGAAPPSFNPPVRRVDPLTLTAVEVEIDGIKKLVGQRIVVTGVSDDTTWHVLKDHLRQCGEVTFCKIYNGGRAAVEFATPEESAKCITELQGSELEGATLFLREDREDTVLTNTRRKIREAREMQMRAKKDEQIAREQVATSVPPGTA